MVGAILFDLINGGDKKWARFPPYRDLGSCRSERHRNFVQTRQRWRGLSAPRPTISRAGSARLRRARPAATPVGALVAVNACGSTIVGGGPHFWAAPFEQNNEFGGRGFPQKLSPDALKLRAKGGLGENTTIAVVATDATLTKAQAKEFAVMAQDGLARAIYPAHTTLDGDTVFAAATCKRPLKDPVIELSELGALAANVLARAVARGVYEATALPFPGALPSWRKKFG